jgi:hypothetical protein
VKCNKVNLQHLRLDSAALDGGRNETHPGVGISHSAPLRTRSTYLVAFDEPTELAPILMCEASCLGDISVTFPEKVLDIFSFEGLNCSLPTFTKITEHRRVMLNGIDENVGWRNFCAVRKHHSSLDYIVQLTNITRPRVPDQLSQRRRQEPFSGDTVFDC